MTRDINDPIGTRPDVARAGDTRPGVYDADAAREPVRDIRTPGERAAARDDRSFTDLIKELRDEGLTLMRQELALFKTEMSEKVSRAGKDAAKIGAGAIMLYLGALFTLIAVTVGLALILDEVGLDEHAWWLAPLIVGVVVGLIGYALTRGGVDDLKHESAVPEKTVQSLKEDKQWLTNQTK